MKEPEPLAVHFKILDYIEEMKAKSKPSIVDMEKYYKLLQVLDRDIGRLKKSRDMWRGRYEDLKALKTKP